MNVKKKLYLSTTNKKVAGVLGGLEEYTGMDATVLRLIFLAFTVLTGFFPGVLVYILAWIIIPEAPHSKVRDAEYTENAKA